MISSNVSFPWPIVHWLLLCLSAFTLILRPTRFAMARPAAYALLTTVLARAISASLELVSPQPYNADDNIRDFRTYKKGQSMMILWSGGDPLENVSISLVQQDFHNLVYPEALRGIHFSAR
jgi:hypothetical protein